MKKFKILVISLMILSFVIVGTSSISTKEIAILLSFFILEERTFVVNSPKRIKASQSEILLNADNVPNSV